MTNQERQPRVTEVVQNSATKGLDRWRRELVLLTDQVGHQMIKMRFSNSESARNEGLTRSAGQRSGGAGQRLVEQELGEVSGRPGPARRSTQRQPRLRRGRTGRSKICREKVRYQGSKKLSQKTRATSKQFRIKQFAIKHNGWGRLKRNKAR